jgi:RimJ/RimL family protein N-acetyltransferase
MIVRGPELYLRAARERDVEALFELSSDLEARGPYFPLTLRSEVAFRNDYQQTGFLGEDRGIFLICGRDDRLLGTVSYFRSIGWFDAYELGYRLFDLRDGQRGVMTEALILATYVMFASRKVNRLELRILTDNEPSRRLAERCGYRFEGVARGAVFHRGRHLDAATYAILRAEFPSTHEATLARLAAIRDARAPRAARAPASAPRSGRRGA